MDDTFEETPVYDEVLNITYKNGDNLGSGKKGKTVKKEKYIDSFFEKKFLDAYFSSTKKK